VIVEEVQEINTCIIWREKKQGYHIGSVFLFISFGNHQLAEHFAIEDK
jgi:hypothetical protein